MIRFAHPEYLYGLFLLLIPAGLFFLNIYRKRRFISTHFSVENADIILGNRSEKKEILKGGLVMTAFALLVFALANPQLGSRIEEVRQVGIDIIVCLDVSMSMKAVDLKPDRLEFAKRELSSLIKGLKGDRIGLVVFAGDAFVQIPLTNDYSAAGLFLNAIDVSSVPVPGTAIAKAISLACGSFEKDSKTQKAIIVISDGEDHEGNLSEALNEAEEKQIAIYTIGIGSPLGSPIPLYGEGGMQTGFKTDEAGKTVLSAVNESMLQDIAQNGRGKYYLANTGGDELDAIFNELSGLEKSEFGVKRITEYEDKYYYFLLPALLLLLLELLISDVKSKALKSLLIRLRLGE